MDLLKNACFFPRNCISTHKILVIGNILNNNFKQFVFLDGVDCEIIITIILTSLVKLTLNFWDFTNSNR